MTTYRILTIEEAAEILKLTPEIVRKYLRRGQLPGRKIGREWRLSERALHDWLSVCGAEGIAFGAARRLPFSVDQFLQEKREEINSEEERFGRLTAPPQIGRSKKRRAS
jgi:excisionase family DNA binding protein